MKSETSHNSRSTLFGRIRAFFLKIQLYVNIGVVIALILSYLSRFISPVDFVWLAFLGLGYPFILFVNIVFVIYWLIRRKLFFLISLIAILLGGKNLSNTFTFTVSDYKPKSNAKQIKVLSYNVRLFNLYQWSDDKKAKKKIFAFLKYQQPDIMCFQEFYSKGNDSLSNAMVISRMPNAKYHHIEYGGNNEKKFNFGIATYSSYPIVNKGVLHSKNNRVVSIFSDIKINNDTIRIYNNHLASVHLGYEDYNLIDSFQEKDEHEQMYGVIGIFRKLEKAYTKRAIEAEIIAENINNSPYKVIVCGDFNDPPVSYSYRKIRGKLTDAFLESGNGFENTYVSKLFPFRIDYILHSKSLKSYKFQTSGIDYSDHFPIMCIFEIN